MTCDTCIHFRPAPGPYTPSECRAHPPAAMNRIVVTEAGSEDVETLSYWPVVEPDDWCGEHRPSPAGAQGYVLGEGPDGRPIMVPAG